MGQRYEGWNLGMRLDWEIGGWGSERGGVTVSANEILGRTHSANTGNRGPLVCAGVLVWNSADTQSGTEHAQPMGRCLWGTIKGEGTPVIVPRHSRAAATCTVSIGKKQKMDEFIIIKI